MDEHFDRKCLKDALGHLASCEFPSYSSVHIGPMIFSPIDFSAFFRISILDESGRILFKRVISHREIRVSLILTHGDYRAALCYILLFNDVFSWFPILNHNLTPEELGGKKQTRCYYSFR